ncbi:hypothetical protein J437_LFUL019522 [Ladona fulva]|uniref:Uncharacterized protein n=1 Tax=Ladona fulva TaxID=123851 RepID=A0A8K0PAF5_LADFU|nr:hypothetical protein J437_LFUL019522 [Ladona fulva]
MNTPQLEGSAIPILQQVKGKFGLTEKARKLEWGQEAIGKHKQALMTSPILGYPNEQQRDPDLQLILEWKESGQKLNWNQVAQNTKAVKSCWAQWNSIGRMDDIHLRMRNNIEQASNRMKDRYDVRAEDGGYQVGDLAWLFNPQRRRRFSPKLQSSWEGTYEVITRIEDVVYRI